MSEVLVTHSCPPSEEGDRATPRLPSFDAKINQVPNGRWRMSWILRISGDSCTSFLVNYCPFCGAKLE